MLTRDKQGRPQAYFDSFAGLIPCRVVRITDKSEMSVVLTAARGAYKRGERVDSNALHVILRGAVYRSRQHCGQFRIRGYDWFRLLGSGSGVSVAAR